MSGDKTQYITNPKKVRVWGKGQFTIPVEIRERLQIHEGTILDVIRVGRSIVVTPERSRVREITDVFEKGMADAGISLSELLSDLREGKHDYEAD